MKGFTMLDETEFTIPIIVASTVSATAVTNPKLSFTYNVEVLGVSLVAGTGPTTSGLIVQLVLNGSNAYTASGTDRRPTIAAGATQGYAGAPDLVSTLTAGQVMSTVVAAVGSGTPGSDLTINLHLRKK